MSMFWVGFTAAISVSGFISALAHTIAAGEPRDPYSHRQATKELLFAFLFLAVANVIYWGSAA